MRSKYYISVGGFFGGENTRAIISSVAKKENWEKCLKGAYEPKADCILKMVETLNVIWAEFSNDSLDKNLSKMELNTLFLMKEFQDHLKEDTNIPTFNMSMYFYRQFEEKHREYKNSVKNELEITESIKAELMEIAEDMLGQIALTIMEYAQRDYM